MITITVPPGASLWSLAVVYLGSGDKWPLIYQVNPQLRPNPNLVIEGRLIKIPVTPPSSVAQPQPAPPDHTGLAVLVAGILLTAISASAAFLELQVAITRQRIRMGDQELEGLRGALEAVYGFPPDRVEGTGSATAIIARLNLTRRAQFVISAGRRIAASLRAARSQGRPLGAALRAAIDREKRYYGQHLQAIHSRMQAAMAVDGAADKYGDLLGWNTVLDRRASAECRAANHKNFYASRMPLIGYPGGVHPHCRCYPGPPYAGAQILPSARMAMAA